ncbi:hypothetical protein BKA65DRAFT_551147 [Rhexocercosporidium sp. MPI-PUGE-AT-0058]|nr:hypothetical protein BKA65DRAFT_551147 [Rhexocercosporidium sp. MPI-PUGE-AT-0058]
MFTPTILLLPTILALGHITSAQQPTPFIPAAHTGYSISTSPTPAPKPSSTRASNATSFTLPTTHFYPPVEATFRFPNTNTNEKDAASVWLALTSVQSTWTKGSEYLKITAAIYEAAPTSARSSLSMSGYNWDKIVQAPWYSDVDASTQNLIQAQEEALQKTFDSMVAKAEMVSDGDRRRIGSMVGMRMAVAVLIGIAMNMYF